MNTLFSNLYRKLIFLFSWIVLPGLLLLQCKDTSETRKKRNATRLDFELIWTELGDKMGKVNVKSDSAVVEVAEFSPDGQVIATGSRKGRQLIIWSVKDGHKIAEHSYENTIESLYFSPDGKLLYIGGEFNYLSIRNTSDWTIYKNVQLPSGIEGMNISNNGKLLALGREDGVISLMKLETLTVIDSLLHGFHGAPPDYGNPDYRADVNSLDFTPDDKYLVSGGYDGDIKIWHLSSNHLEKSLHAHKGSIKYPMKVIIQSKSGILNLATSCMNSHLQLD